MQSEATFATAMLLDLFEGDRAAVVDLLIVAAKTIDRDVVRIEAALSARDTRALAEAAHSLKGASAGIGADSVAELSATIERSAVGSSPADRITTAQLRAASSALIADIESFCGERAS